MQPMSERSWQHLGHLTPDTPECQRDVWALLGLLRQRLADVHDEIALRTAEPTWAASLSDAAGRARALADHLGEEAGQDARERLAADDLVLTLDASLGEILTSDHVPSLLATGFAVLGELGAVPARLLDEVAGSHARLLAGRVADCSDHGTLARLLSMAEPSKSVNSNLRRLLRHLNGELFTVYRSWRQTFHALGVDGEWVDERSSDAAAAAAGALGLPFTAADRRPFAH